MDFQNAALLIAVIVAATGFVRRLVPRLDGWHAQVAALAVAVGSVFLLGETVWAHEQVIGGQALDALGVADKIVVGALLGFGANVLDRTLRTVASVGENTDAPPL